jgi:hypothetical protein
MNEFPRTMVGGVSVSRMIIGTNWLLGFSHTSAAKDNWIKGYHTAKSIADILSVYFENGIDTIMGNPTPTLRQAMDTVEQKFGRKAILIATPGFNIVPGGPAANEPEPLLDEARKYKATFCMPHQCVTDALLDRMHGVIRDMDKYSKMIRERGMIPGLSTHMPETVVIADKTGLDVESYIQIYNSAGFMMQIEVDWVMRIISDAKKPVMTIKPMAAGRLTPVVGLAFVWNTIRDQDMVTVGTTTPDEAREVIELSLDFINGRIPYNKLQETRSKKSLKR